MTLRDLARKVLAESLLPLTAKQVWDEAVKRGLDKQVETKGKTPDATVAAYLYTQSKKPGSGIVATGTKPAAFSLSVSVSTGRASSPSEPRRGSGAQPPSVADTVLYSHNQKTNKPKISPPSISGHEPTVWGIHSRDDALFRHDNLIAIGWSEMGNLSKLPNNRDAFKARFAQAYPDSKKAAIPTGAGMLYRFIYEADIGDYVVYPSKEDRKINIGIVDGEYSFDPTHHYAHQRKVKWIKQFSRDLFSPRSPDGRAPKPEILCALRSPRPQKALKRTSQATI